MPQKLFGLHFVTGRDSDRVVVRFVIMALTVDGAVERGKELLVNQTPVHPGLTGFIVLDQFNIECARFYVTDQGDCPEWVRKA